MPPSLVHVYTDTGKCSGVVISPTEVLTAGHCIEGSTFGYITHDAAPDTIYVVTHAAVNGPWGEDSALLYVHTPLTPAALGEAAAGPVDLVGYGCVGTGRIRQAFARPVEIAGVSARPVIGCGCPGDSGGPVYRHDKVVGLLTHVGITDHTRVYITDITVLGHLRGLMSVLLAQYPEATDP